jgi:ABC-type dipeptide/oligopeptide/nickel transport system permease component
MPGDPAQVLAGQDATPEIVEEIRSRLGLDQPLPVQYGLYLALDALGEDYVRTAVAKGVGARGVLWRHALRNALIPPVTFAGLEFGRMLGGIIAVETIFAWPGVGKALVDAIAGRDFPVIQGLVLTFALLFALVNLAVDVVNGLIDPRARYG